MPHDNLPDAEARELLRKELSLLEERVRKIRESYRQVEVEKAKLGDVSKIVAQIRQAVDLCLHLQSEISGITNAGYYGAQLRDQPAAVDDLRALNEALQRVFYALNKIMAHLEKHEGLLHSAELDILEFRRVLANATGIRRIVSRALVHMDPRNHKRLTRYVLEPGHLRWNINRGISSCEMTNHLLSLEVQLEEQDLQMISSSIKILQGIGDHIHKNLETWMQPEKRHSIFDADYRENLVRVHDTLKHLIRLLDEIAADEQHVNLLGVRIIRLSRDEMQTLVALQRRLT